MYTSHSNTGYVINCIFKPSVELVGPTGFLVLLLVFYKVKYQIGILAVLVFYWDMVCASTLLYLRKLGHLKDHFGWEVWLS